MTVITAIFCAECDRRAPLDEWMPMMYRVPITHGREVVAYVALFRHRTCRLTTAVAVA